MIPCPGIDLGTARERRKKSSKSGRLASKRGDPDTIPLSLAVEKYPLRERWRDVGCDGNETFSWSSACIEKGQAIYFNELAREERHCVRVAFYT